MGEPNTLPVVEFVRRVKELARARGASEADLYEGASDFFDESALMWYRAGMANGSFRDWEGLERELLKDFRAYDYGDNLYDFIRNRLQKPMERIVTFFANMEDLFLKLNQPLSDMVKVEMIRRNLRPEILRSLGVNTYASINDLKAHCKVIEADLKRIQDRTLTQVLQEPHALPKSVKFTDQIRVMDSCGMSVADYNSREENNKGRDSSNRISASSSSSSYSNASQAVDSYREMEPDQWNESVRQLSVRNETHLPRYDVPPPSFPQQQSSSSQNRTYYAPERGQRANYDDNVSGNERGRSNWTNQAPHVLRRPQ